ncbi:MAG TPA: class D sortase [Candidatus Saccharimonadales bacterium]|nr:class D sortase [Candidatus Saccharimonadales bacterium]
MQPNDPLFAGNSQPATPAGDTNGYLLPRSERRITPSGTQAGASEAADLIRKKIAAIYAEEPDAQQEEREAAVVKPRSKHQQFMYELTTSGKSLAEIQTAWHQYYAGLPDAEKHAVWQEFYEATGAVRSSSGPAAATVFSPAALPAAPRTPATSSVPVPPATPAGVIVSQHHQLPLNPAAAKRATVSLRQTIRSTVTANGKLNARHHLQSLLFGLAVGCVTLVVFLFSFFNEVIIAPFIQPGRTAGATPIIVDPSAVTATSTPEVIIPKINLEIPVDFTQTSTNEADIENALENGIVHYPSTVMPGEQGNAAFFGHSSNNIFNPGKYKFAFVLLHELVPGDTFYITYGGKVYIYKVFSKQIVDPSDVGVLNNIAGHTATATLITCDPPGTSLHRLVVVGDQISPDPAGNNAGQNTTAATVSSSQLPGNGPTLWSRLWHAVF